MEVINAIFKAIYLVLAVNVVIRIIIRKPVDLDCLQAMVAVLGVVVFSQ